MPAQALDAGSPFAGLQAFAEGDQAYFHGRDAERQELFRLVRRESLTVLFGRSGLGKTSLLQAGLCPLLRDASYLPISIRLDFTPGDTLEGRLKDRIGEVLRDHGVEARPPERGETLWEYFHQVRWWSARNRLLTPVLLIDQMEEIFTLGRGDARVRPLLTELADLIENRIPAAVRERLGDGELPFSYDRQTARAVLALREDFLPHLEELRSLVPALARNRFRLTPLRGRQALESILRPGGGLITAEVAMKILRLVTGLSRDEMGLDEVEVEPALLSLFCRELNDRRLEQGLPAITAGLVHAVQGQILAGFYARSLAGQRREVRSFIEDRLLTASGFRHSEPLEEALGLPGVTAEALGRLVDRRLLRLEPRLGRLHVELIHDVLTAVVQESRDRRRTRERRYRRLRRAAAGLVLLGGLSVAVLLVAAGELRQRRAADADRARAEEVIHYILTDFSAQFRPLGQLGLLKDTQRAAIRYFRSLPESGDTAASARHSSVALVQIGDIYVYQGKVDLAMKFLLRGVEAAEALRARDPRSLQAQETLAEAYDRLSYARFIAGDFPGSLAAGGRALEIAERLVAQSPADSNRKIALAGILDTLSQPLLYQRSYGLAADRLSRSVQILDEAAGQATGSLELLERRSEAHTALAAALFGQGKLQAAGQEVSRGLAFIEPAAAANPGNLMVQNRLAQAYALAGTISAAQGDTARGLELCGKAVEIHARLLAIDPGSAAAGFNLSNSSVSLARLLLAVGQPQEALGHATRALAIRRRIAAGTPGNPNSLLILGEAEDLTATLETALGRSDRAREAWTRGVAALAPVMAETDRPDLLEIYSKMLLALGRAGEAQPVSGRALAAGKQHQP